MGLAKFKKTDMINKKGEAMEKVLETLKSLYRGQDVVKRHLIYSLLFILPAIAGSIKSYVDKDMPTTLKMVLLIGALIFFVLSIIPWFTIYGVTIKFINNRYCGIKENIPEVNKESLVLGLKAFPLVLVWCIYSIILFIALVAIAAIPSVIIGIKILWLGILLGVLLITALVIAMILFTPFFSFIIIEYAKDFKYLTRLFNPLTIIEYIKKSFKPSIIVALKYLLAGIIAAFGTGFIYLIFVLLLLVVMGVMAFISPENANIEYHPVYITVFVLIMTICGVIESYINSIVGLSYTADLIDVYKENLEEKE